MSMTCEKCAQGTMAAVKLWRFSGCLVAIGATLLIPAVLSLIGATLLVIVGFVTTATQATRTAAIPGQAKAEALMRLRAIPIDDALVNEFDQNLRINDLALARLAPRERREAENAISTYQTRLAHAGVGAVAIGGLGTVFVVGVYAAAIPAFIVGLVLLLRKKVWKCTECGYIFDRA